MRKKKNTFSKNFFWGASVSSHQVEGGNHNQWSVWELQNAKDLAKTASDRLGWLPNWEQIKHQAEDSNNYISGDGVKHYTNYKEDFALLKKLNLNAFRFGIEWSRLEPEEGRWNEEAFRHYHQYIRQLKKMGVEPFMNVWHWTLPTWFAEKGGFSNRKNFVYWRRFVEKIAQEYSKELNYIITINEPNVYASFGYGAGLWPPGEKNWFKALYVGYNLVSAHRICYKIFKAEKPSLQIGIAHQLANIQAKRPHNIIDQIATKWMRYIWNWWFFNRIRKFQDFVGFNYYFTDYYYYNRRDNPKVPINDLGWYMEPEGLYPLLLRAWAHYRKPIIVTENGVADEQDTYRQWWLQETIVAMERAMSEGVQLSGYFHWSLLDNFEWAYGWWPKFGLVDVDRKNGMKRSVRASAKWYAEKVRQLRQG